MNEETIKAGMEVKRVCQHDGTWFTAQTSVTKYLEAVAPVEPTKPGNGLKRLRQAMRKPAKSSKPPFIELQAKDFLSVEEVCKLFAVSLTTAGCEKSRFLKKTSCYNGD